MRLESSYSVIVTARIGDCRDFYQRWFGCEAVFEATWFVLLRFPDSATLVAFMTPDHPSSPPGPDAFNGRGVFLTLQVTDAAAEFARLESSGAVVAYPLRTEPWGQKRFALVDPAGTWVDIVEQVEAAPGFWDPYLARA